MWVSTSDGLDRFRPDAVNPAPVPAKFDFFSLAAGPAGSLLIGTREDGLQRLENGEVTRVDCGHQDTITCVYQAPDGKLWLGGHAELGYVPDGQYKAVALPEELRSPARDTQAMTLGPDGELWLQVQTRLGIFRLHGDKWIGVPNALVKPGNAVAVVMNTDHEGRAWAGYLDGRIVLFDGEKRRKIAKEDGLTVGNVLALFPSADGMWIGGEHGLEIMPADHPVELKFAGDTSIDGISGITREYDGSLWLNSLPGILRIPSSEVEQALKDHTYAMHYRLFNYLDGLSAKAPQLRPMPSILKGRQQHALVHHDKRRCIDQCRKHLHQRGHSSCIHQVSTRRWSLFRALWTDYFAERRQRPADRLHRTERIDAGARTLSLQAGGLR